MHKDIYIEYGNKGSGFSFASRELPEIGRK